MCGSAGDSVRRPAPDFPADVYALAIGTSCRVAFFMPLSSLLQIQSRSQYQTSPTDSCRVTSFRLIPFQPGKNSSTFHSKS
jgi:hypothetical protein